jgi:hypothetical protein
MTLQYKIQCVGERTAWELFKTKYSDILDLFKAKLLASEREAKDVVRKVIHPILRYVRVITHNKQKLVLDILKFSFNSSDTTALETKFTESVQE